MSGYFTMTPTIIDNDASNHNSVGCCTQITFEPGHNDDHDRRCFHVHVTVDDERITTLMLHYQAAAELCKALKGAMKGDEG